MAAKYNSSSLELEYIFIGMKFNVEFDDDNDMFTEDEKNSIRALIEAMSSKIFIDKSYVEYSGNTRKDVFMLESGWNALKDLLVDSKYGQHLNSMPHAPEVVIDAFATMGRCYMYECLAKVTDKTQSINISLDPKCVFDVILCKDMTHDQKHYIGRWQDWEFDDDGHFLSSSANVDNRKKK